MGHFAGLFLPLIFFFFNLSSYIFIFLMLEMTTYWDTDPRAVRFLRLLPRCRLWSSLLHSTLSNHHRCYWVTSMAPVSVAKPRKLWIIQSCKQRETLCVCVCLWVCLCVYVCVHVCECACMHLCVCVWAWVCTFICTIIAKSNVKSCPDKSWTYQQMNTQIMNSQIPPPNLTSWRWW